MPLQFITSNEGKKELVHDGYIYTKHRENKNSITWRCCEYKTKIHCHNIIHIDSDKNNGMLICVS